MHLQTICQYVVHGSTCRFTFKSPLQQTNATTRAVVAWPICIALCKEHPHELHSSHHASHRVSTTYHIGYPPHITYPHYGKSAFITMQTHPGNRVKISKPLYLNPKKTNAECANQSIYVPYLRLARTIYIRCIYGIFGLEITKYTAYIYVYIWFWPTLTICCTQHMLCSLGQRPSFKRSLFTRAPHLSSHITDTLCTAVLTNYQYTIWVLCIFTNSMYTVCDVTLCSVTWIVLNALIQGQHTLRTTVCEQEAGLLYTLQGQSAPLAKGLRTKD